MDIACHNFFMEIASEPSFCWLQPWKLNFSLQKRLHSYPNSKPHAQVDLEAGLRMFTTPTTIQRPTTLPHEKLIVKQLHVFTFIYKPFILKKVTLL